MLDTFHLAELNCAQRAAVEHGVTAAGACKPNAAAAVALEWR